MAKYKKSSREQIENQYDEKARREALDKLNFVIVPPDDAHRQMTPSQVLKALFETGDWSRDDLASALMYFDGTSSSQTVKDWLNANAIPKDPPNDGPKSRRNRSALEDLIRERCTPEVASQWINALYQSWQRHKAFDYNDAGATNSQRQKSLLKVIKQDRRLHQLPALFGSDLPLPLADSYVDLSVVTATRRAATKYLLDYTLSLTEKLARRYEARFTARQLPKHALDEASRKRTVIIGPPGSGKSSLLRRLASDIASNDEGRQWKNFKIPLLVEVREYWLTRNSQENEDLFEFAIRQLASGESDRKKFSTTARRSKSILLVDGLDEIASDPQAVAHIFGQLKRQSFPCPWIATSRPTGLVAELHEDVRLEMLELDEEAIERLIENWCSSVSQVQPEELKTEIFSHSGSRSMAGNPFLLAALCFIKSISPGDELPSTRIAIYETLFRQIRHQAQQGHPDLNILDPAATNDLARFCLNLYTDYGQVRQIFSIDDWEQFKLAQQITVDTNFHRQIKPARLLTQWSTDIPQFHFIHLTLQEHLIARALVSKPLEFAMKQRFSPAWRSVFRFYGALLWDRGRRSEFKQLVTQLSKEEDINKLSLITLAEIFADAGISNTVEFINDDLRESLYAATMAGFDAAPEAMVDALAMLDGEWLERRVHADMDETLELFVLGDHDEESYPGREYVAYARTAECPYEKLARTRTANGRKTIRDAFWGDDQPKAIMAAVVYGRIALPSERRIIVDRAMETTVFDNMATRLFVFAQSSLRSDLLEFVGKVAHWHVEEADGLFEDASQLIADIGGSNAADLLEELAIRELDILNDEWLLLNHIPRNIVRLGGEAALRIFDKMALHPNSVEKLDFIECLKIEALPTDIDSILKLLDNASLRDNILSAISGALNYGRSLDQKIISRLAEMAGNDMFWQTHELALIESARLENGEPPVLASTLLDQAEICLSEIHSENDESKKQIHVTTLFLIFDGFAKGCWIGARAIVRKILVGEEYDSEVVDSAINLAGHIFDRDHGQDIIKLLENHLFDDEGESYQTAALAIGRIDLERLFLRQDAETAFYALEQIAAENNLLVFDQFWTDATGQVHRWQFPVLKVLHVHDTEAPGLPSLLWHELSRYGFHADIDEPDNCVAFIIYAGLDGFGKDIAEQARRLAQSDSSKQIFYISSDLSEEEARRRGREIGQQLFDIHGHNLPAPVLSSSN